MYKRQIKIICSFILAIVLASAACEGPEGPQGPRGEQGPPGPAGADGSIIHAGEGAPDAELGNIGDFYLDLATGNLFGPKMAEEWGPQGEQGSQGPEGNANVTLYVFEGHDFSVNPSSWYYECIEVADETEWEESL